MIVGQEPNENVKKEQEFQELLKKSKEIQVKSEVAINVATEQSNKTITKAANTIVTLKEEVKELKQELNETKKKLDSTNDVGNDIKFNLLPISGGEENR